MSIMITHRTTLRCPTALQWFSEGPLTSTAPPWLRCPTGSADSHQLGNWHTDNWQNMAVIHNYCVLEHNKECQKLIQTWHWNETLWVPWVGLNASTIQFKALQLMFPSQHVLRTWFGKGVKDDLPQLEKWRTWRRRTWLEAGEKSNSIRTLRQFEEWNHSIKVILITFVWIKIQAFSPLPLY